MDKEQLNGCSFEIYIVWKDYDSHIEGTPFALEYLHSQTNMGATLRDAGDDLLRSLRFLPNAHRLLLQPDRLQPAQAASV